MKLLVTILGLCLLSGSAFGEDLRCEISDPCAGRQELGTCLDKNFQAAGGNILLYNQAGQHKRTLQYSITAQGNLQDRAGFVNIQAKQSNYEGYILVPYGQIQDEENIIFNVTCYDASVGHERR